jgi:hypothetical protein
MKEFWASCVAIAVITVVAWVLLTSLDMSAANVFSVSGVRL